MRAVISILRSISTPKWPIKSQVYIQSKSRVHPLLNEEAGLLSEKTGYHVYRCIPKFIPDFLLKK